jgi:hypothetical protein
MRIGKIGMMMGVLLLLAAMVLADGESEHDFTEAKQLIESKVSCADLSDEQLESMGDYYMEQMHPGEAHELMDEMHGGEGSASLKQMHINMAKRLYCKESISMGSSMMGGGMMGGGMMGGGTMMGYGTGMMSTGWWPLWQLLYLLIVVGILVLIILLIIKLWNSLQKKR